ncbi:12369_t:CDS:2, partial [Racocetra fulgida]
VDFITEELEKSSQKTVLERINEARDELLQNILNRNEELTKLRKQRDYKKRSRITCQDILGSKTLEADLELVEYGLFGDIKVSENIIEILTIDDNYANNVPVVVTKPSTFEIDSCKIGTAQANSKTLFVIHMIDTKAYEMIEYSNKFNKAEKILVCRSMKDIILILHLKIHSLISIYGYSEAFNIKYLELESKFNRVIIKHLPNDYHIIILDKNTYKIKDTINYLMKVSKHYKEYTKLKTKIGDKEEIFDNNLIGIEFYLEKLVYILDAIFYNIELNKYSIDVGYYATKWICKKCQQEKTHLDNCTYLVNNLQGESGENKIVEGEAKLGQFKNKMEATKRLTSLQSDLLNKKTVFIDVERMQKVTKQ